MDLEWCDHFYTVTKCVVMEITLSGAVHGMLATVTRPSSPDSLARETIVHLVNSDQLICQFKHVVMETDNYELGILITFLNENMVQ